MRKLKFAKLLVIIAFIFAYAYSANAAIIGVSPSILRYSNMLKEGYAQTTITVSTSSPQEIKAHFINDGELQDWLILPEENFVFSSEKPYTFTLIIQPPPDAKNGNYSDILKIRIDELASVESGAGSAVVAQIGLLIYIDITGEERIECRAGGISVGSTEIGKPFNVRSTVNNDGNVRLRPEININVYDQYKTNVVYSTKFLGDMVLPTTSRETIKEINHNLGTGQYFAEVFVKECKVTKMTTFDIVEKGGIADVGELLGIRTNEITYLNEPMIIAPMFRNSGERKVLAQFKGQIQNLKTGKIVSAIESDQLEVEPGATTELRMFYTPKSEGDFQITGRVVYNNKITFDESSKTLKVVRSESKFKISTILILILYFIVGFMILIMITKIRRAKKKKF